MEDSTWNPWDEIREQITLKQYMTIYEYIFSIIPDTIVNHPIPVEYASHAIILVFSWEYGISCIICRKFQTSGGETEELTVHGWTHTTTHMVHKIHHQMYFLRALCYLSHPFIINMAKNIMFVIISSLDKSMEVFLGIASMVWNNIYRAPNL